MKTVLMVVATVELARTVAMMFLAQPRKKSLVILVLVKSKNNDLLATLMLTTNVHASKMFANVNQNLNAKFKLAQKIILQSTNWTFVDAAKS
jgi:hypothetical protein